MSRQANKGLRWYLRPALDAYKAAKYFAWYYREAPRLRSFKDKHLGEDCFIMGNGPSLNKMNLGLLNDYHIFGLNKIYLIFQKVQLDLSYLVAVNNLVIEQSKTIYENFDRPIFVADNRAKGVLARRPHIYRLKTDGGMSWDFRGDIEQPIYEGCTVTFVAMQIAYYMGFQNVYLIGVDHNFVQTGKPHEQQLMTNDDPNHFDPNYFKGAQWHLADLKGSELSYHLANYAYNRTHRRIYDATVDGKLDIFPKISFEQALQQAKKKS